MAFTLSSSEAGGASPVTRVGSDKPATMRKSRGTPSLIVPNMLRVNSDRRVYTPAQALLTLRSNSDARIGVGAVGDRVVVEDTEARYLRAGASGLGLPQAQGQPPAR